MATENIKEYLNEALKIPQSHLKRTHKKTLLNGDIVRVFKDTSSQSEIETVEYEDGNIRYKIISGPLKNDVFRTLSEELSEFYINKKVPDFSNEFSFLISNFFDFSTESFTNPVTKQTITDPNTNDIAKGAIIQIKLRDFEINGSHITFLTPLLQYYFSQFSVNFKEVTPGNFEVLSESTFKDVYLALRCNGFFHDPSDSIYGDYADDSYDYSDFFNIDTDDIEYEEYVAFYKNGLTYLQSNDNDNDNIFGPFLRPEDAEPIINLFSLDIIHYPEDICFDLKESNEFHDTIEIHLGSNINLSHDNLGGHNVLGLPPYLSSCDQENQWSIKDKTLQQVKDDMLNCGFIYVNFLADR